jgi:hypothetical protein
LLFHDPTLFMFISYDIVCVWWVHLMERLMELPLLVHCFLIMPMICFVISKMHIKGHGPKCGPQFSLNLVPGSSQTDGEGIERPWSNISGIAASTRIMGPGARHDMIDDHWSHWNWQKLVSLGTSSLNEENDPGSNVESAAILRQRLDNAREQEEHSLCFLSNSKIMWRDGRPWCMSTRRIRRRRTYTRWSSLVSDRTEFEQKI